MSEYTIKTVSGSVVTFNDSGDNLPLSSCIVTIPPNLDGVSSADVVQMGGNIFSSEWEQGSINTSGANQTNTNVIRTAGFIRVFENIHYSFTRDITTDIVNFRGYDAEQNYIGSGSTILNLITGYSVTNPMRAGDSTCTIEIKSGSGVAYIRMNDYSNDLSVKYTMCVGDTPLSQYSSYISETDTANFDMAVYGGSVDVINGTGTETNELVPFSDCTWSAVTSYQSNFNADNGIISLRFGKNAMATAGYAQTVDGVACVFDNNNRSVWNNVSRLNEIGYTDGISVNLHYSDIGLSEWTSNASDTLAAWRSSQLYQTGAFSLVKATPESFTFTPVPINSRLGDNTIWSNLGDIEVSYYSFVESVGRYIISGSTLIDIADAIREKKETTAPINVSDFANEILTISGGGGQPTLVSKMITENGTYLASDDEADGYSDVTVNVSSGGAQYPQATKTLIVDNTSLTNTLNFTDLYTNYDFLEIVTYNSSSQKETTFLLTPSMITASFTYSSNLINFNEFNSDQYVCYRKTSDTVWTRNNSRNLNIKTIYGLTLNNATKTETELYSREAISGSNISLIPPTGKTFYDYDYILFMTCTGSSDETQPCNSIFMNPVKDCMFDNVVSKTININKYNAYQSSTVEADSITSYRYFYVIGLNFEYT